MAGLQSAGSRCTAVVRMARRRRPVATTPAVCVVMRSHKASTVPWPATAAVLTARRLHVVPTTKAVPLQSTARLINQSINQIRKIVRVASVARPLRGPLIE